MCFKRSFILSFFLWIFTSPVLAITPISNCFELQGMQNDIAGDYILNQNIDCTNSEFTPVGSLQAPFTGTLNGADYKIDNLKVVQSSFYTGLFGVTQNAKISHLHFENVDIKGHIFVGALVGLALNTIITNVSASGSITAPPELGNVFYNFGGVVGALSDHSKIEKSSSSVAISGPTNISNSLSTVGGLVGIVEKESQVIDSYATGNIVGTNELGGLAGQVTTASSVIRSHATGKVLGVNSLGGLVGALRGGTITRSYAKGDVDQYGGIPAYGSIGGLVGGIGNSSPVTTNQIYQNFAQGNVNKNTNYRSGEGFGGLIGNLAGGNNDPCPGLTSPAISVVKDNFATGDVYGPKRVAGLIGYANRGLILRNYSIGLVPSNRGEDSNGLAVIGNCVFKTSNDWIDNFWDTQTSKIPFSTTSKYHTVLQLGLTTAQMQQKSTYTAVRWNFDTVWSIDEEHAYPCLIGVSCPETKN